MIEGIIIKAKYISILDMNISNQSLTSPFFNIIKGFPKEYDLKFHNLEGIQVKFAY